MSIPNERLLLKAAALEGQTEGWFRRQDQWPEDWQEIWPELAQQAPAAINSEAGEVAHG